MKIIKDKKVANSVRYTKIEHKGYILNILSNFFSSKVQLYLSII